MASKKSGVEQMAEDYAKAVVKLAPVPRDVFRAAARSAVLAIEHHLHEDLADVGWKGCAQAEVESIRDSLEQIIEAEVGAALDKNLESE